MATAATCESGTSDLVEGIGSAGNVTKPEQQEAQKPLNSQGVGSLGKEECSTSAKTNSGPEDLEETLEKHQKPPPKKAQPYGLPTPPPGYSWDVSKLERNGTPFADFVFFVLVLIIVLLMFFG